MKYTKMHGAGNDFIIINNMVEKIPQMSFPQIAKTLCSRRTSIGADGIMFVERPKQEGDFRMYFYNADGTEGEMCGNGARCICRFGYETGLAGYEQKVETISGMVIGWRIDKRIYKVRLNKPSEYIECIVLKVDEREYECSYVELGNPGLPHLVIRMPGFNKWNEEDLFRLGKELRSHKNLYKGANVNFYYISDEGHVEARTFERGVEDFTLACGTGAGSIGYVLSKTEGKKDELISINMPGGVLGVQILDCLDGDEDIFLSGPATMVSEGTVLDEDLIY